MKKSLLSAATLFTLALAACGPTINEVGDDSVPNQQIAVPPPAPQPPGCNPSAGNCPNLPPPRQPMPREPPLVPTTPVCPATDPHCPQVPPAPPVCTQVSDPATAVTGEPCCLEEGFGVLTPGKWDMGPTGFYCRK